MIEQIDPKDFAERVLASDRPMLVDFTATWCPPCRMQKPVLTAFAASHPGFGVVAIDADLAPELTLRYGVKALPTLVLFDGGEPVARATGLQSPSRLEELVRPAA